MTNKYTVAHTLTREYVLLASSTIFISFIVLVILLLMKYYKTSFLSKKITSFLS